MHKDYYYVINGPKLFELRIQAGFDDAQQLADELKIARKTVQSWENETQGLFPRNFYPLCKVLATRLGRERYEIEKELVKGRRPRRDVRQIKKENEKEAQVKEGFDKSAYLQLLIERLHKELEAISYVPRTLRAVQSHHQALTDLSFIQTAEDIWTVEKILESKRNFVIIGEPGIGKTILLYKLALEAASMNQLPIYVDLRFVSGGLKGLKDQVRYQARTYTGKANASLVLSEQDLSNSQLIFLFDHAEQTHLNVIDSINELIAERNEIEDQLIIGCRANFDHYYSRIYGTTQIIIDKLELSHINKIMSANDAQHLHPELGINSRLLEFGRNLSMIALKRPGKIALMEPGVIGLMRPPYRSAWGSRNGFMVRVF